MSLFDDIITDSAVLIANGVHLTATRDGLMFEPGEEWDDFVYPGRAVNTKRCRELVRLNPTIKGTAMMTGEAQVSAYRPNGVWADSETLEDVRIFTPGAARTELTLAHYLTDVFCVWKRQGGDYLAVEFQYAINSSWSIGAADGDEGLLQIAIEAAQNPASGTTKTRIPYRVHTLPGITQLADL